MVTRRCNITLYNYVPQMKVPLSSIPVLGVGTVSEQITEEEVKKVCLSFGFVYVLYNRNNNREERKKRKENKMMETRLL